MAFSSLSVFLPGTRKLAFSRFLNLVKEERIPLKIIDEKGRTWAFAAREPEACLKIRDPRFFNALISPNAYSLGQAYVEGYFDLTGNIRDLYGTVRDKLLTTDQGRGLSPGFMGSLGTRVRALFKKARNREKENIEYQYDLPGAFFRIFLGKTMGYTCGYYDTRDTTMSQAQVRKMDIICQKLRLSQGDRLLDIGCGWGNFAVYAAARYGASVTGITLSRTQKAWADKWVENKGLTGQVTIKLLNYRDLGREEYDKIACVGMSEHVGRANMNRFFNIVFNSLKPGGLFLQHTITQNAGPRQGTNNRFLDTYMFPGGDLMYEQDLVDRACRAGFELLNAENFRPHYARTLADWISHMEKEREKLLALVPESVYRIFHVFFIGSMIAFQEKEIALFQNLFHKGGRPEKDPDGPAYFSTGF